MLCSILNNYRIQYIYFLLSLSIVNVVAVKFVSKNTRVILKIQFKKKKSIFQFDQFLHQRCVTPSHRRCILDLKDDSANGLESRKNRGRATAKGMNDSILDDIIAISSDYLCTRGARALTGKVLTVFHNP